MWHLNNYNKSDYVSFTLDIHYLPVSAVIVVFGNYEPSFSPLSRIIFSRTIGDFYDIHDEIFSVMSELGLSKSDLI